MSGTGDTSEKRALRKHFSRLISKGKPAPDTERIRQPADAASESVTFDEKGNPVWKWKAPTGDYDPLGDTIDFVKSLENESLSLKDDPVKQNGSGLDPYNNSKPKP